MSLGAGLVFVSIAAANAGVPGDKAGLAAGLLNASQQIGSALGLAILSVLAITRTTGLIAANTPPVVALDSGYHRPCWSAARQFARESGRSGMDRPPQAPGNRHRTAR